MSTHISRVVRSSEVAPVPEKLQALGEVEADTRPAALRGTRRAGEIDDGQADDVLAEVDDKRGDLVGFVVAVQNGGLNPRD